MVPLALFGSFGAAEIALVLAIAVLLFGGRKIPDLARGLGEGIRNFRTSLKGPEDPDADGKSDGEAAKRSDG